MTKTLSVSAIKNGTVIDHIPAGQALRIIRLLNLLRKKYRITVGFNLSSKRLGAKDLIKIENHILSDAEANEVTVFAPEATINIIEDFEVTKKISTRLPENIIGVFVCPNPLCITHNEPIASCFHISEYRKQVKLTCKYCEKQFDRDYVKESTA
jgi:aspartate carbamoyltransferase regulatory subunit